MQMERGRHGHGRDTGDYDHRMGRSIDAQGGGEERPEHTSWGISCIRIHGGQGENASLTLDVHLLEGLVQMQLGPLDRVQRRLQELLGRVLLADVLFREALLGELLDEQLVAGLQVLLGEAGVVDERLVLQREGRQF